MMKRPDYVLSQPAEIIRYVESGEHAFVGCDDPDIRNEFVSLLMKSLTGSPIDRLVGSESADYDRFADLFLNSCNQLATQIGKRLPSRTYSLHSLFNETMQLYVNSDHQGFLVFDNVDPIVQIQHMYEIEGSLRSVMQFHRDIAVVLCGSNNIINEIGQSDRPFYLSFRIFRL